MPSASLINRRVIALLIACSTGAACNNKPAETPVAARVHKIIPEEATDLVSLMSEPVKDSSGKLGAKVKGKLTAPYMLRFQLLDSPYAEFPRSLHVDFYNDSLKTESQLDAKYGKYLSNQDKV